MKLYKTATAPASGRGEVAGDDAAHDDDDEEQTGERREESSGELARADACVHGIATPFGDRAGDDHEEQTNEKAGHVSSNEQSCDRNATGSERVDDENVARRDHEARRCR